MEKNDRTLYEQWLHALGEDYRREHQCRVEHHGLGDWGFWTARGVGAGHPWDPSKYSEWLLC